MIAAIGSLAPMTDDPSRWRISAAVSEADIVQVEAGQDVEFTVDAFPDRRFRGRVLAVGNEPITQANVVAYNTAIEVINPEPKFRPGMTANLKFITAHRAAALKIPMAALRFRPAGSSPGESRTVDARQFEQIVWPTEKSRYPAMRFSTEVFVKSVVADIESRHRLDTNRIFTLAWSSGGPAAYAVSLDPQTRVTGSFIAMSVFNSGQLPALAAAKGRAYFLLHSPTDFIPMSMPEQAREALGSNGAQVRLQTYEGGHGWHANVFGNIRAGVQWLEKSTGTD